MAWFWKSQPKTENKIAMLLMDELRLPDPPKLVEAANTLFPDLQLRFLDADDSHDEQGPPIARYEADGISLVLMGMPVRIPDSEFEFLIPASWQFPTLADAVASHTAHLMIVASAALPAVEVAVRLTRMAAAVLDCIPATAVYWGDGPVANSPDMFNEIARAASDGLAVPLWVGLYSFSTGQERVLGTLGMEQFGRREIEVITPPKAGGEEAGFLMDLAHYILSGADVQPGHTVGDPENPIRVSKAKSRVDPKRTVLQLDRL